MLCGSPSPRRINCDGRDSFIYRSCPGVPCRQLPHAPENPSALLSTSEKRAIDLAWAKPFDGNSPLIRYILEVSENSKSHLGGVCAIVGLRTSQRLIASPASGKRDYNVDSWASFHPQRNRGHNIDMSQTQSCVRLQVEERLCGLV